MHFGLYEVCSELWKGEIHDSYFFSSLMLLFLLFWTAFFEKRRLTGFLTIQTFIFSFFNLKDFQI